MAKQTHHNHASSDSRSLQGRRSTRYRLVSIRQSLFWNLVLLMFMIAAALLGVSYMTTRNAVQSLSQSLLSRTADLTHDQLTQFFRPARGILQIMADWVERGQVNLDNAEELNGFFLPMLDRFPQLSSLNTGDELGRGFMLMRQENGWRNREVNRQAWGTETRWTERDEKGSIIRQWRKDLDYDPRTRPWFTGGQSIFQEIPPDASSGPWGRPVFWTEPYTFFTTRQPGITVSLPVRSDRGTVPRVLALDVLLEDVSKFTQSLTPSPNGIAFVMTDDGSILGMPGDGSSSSKDEEMAHPGLPQVGGLTEFPMAVLGSSIWFQEKEQSEEPFSFKLGKETWWADFKPFALSETRNLWIGVMVPRHDILGELEKQRNLSLLVMAGALVFGAGMVFLLSRRYSKPIRTLVEHSDEMRRLNLEPKEMGVTHLEEIHHLSQAQERMRGALESFAKYVPTDVVRELVDQGQAARIGGKIETLTVMFSDIRGFTSIAESMPPKELMLYLESYFNELKEVLDTHQATIDKFIGDAILAFWGAPVENSNHARDAVMAAWECVACLKEFNCRAEAAGRPRLHTNFGLATGRVVVGNVGASGRLNYSVIGNTVNLASRLEGLNKFYGTDILVNQSVKDLAGDALVWRHIDNVTVKGGSQSVDIFEPLGKAGEVSSEVLSLKESYEKALNYYFQRRFEEALLLLKEGERVHGEDSAWKLLTDRCAEFKDQPPPEDWNTSFRFRQK